MNAQFVRAFALSLVVFAVTGCFERPRVLDPDRRIASFTHSGLEGASCSQCHEKDRPVLSASPVVLGFDGTSPAAASAVHGSGADCLQCHKAGGSWAEVTAYDHKDPSISCARCHESKRPALVQGVAHGGGADCNGCHRGGTIWKDVLAFSHNPVPSECRLCHEVSRPLTTTLPSPSGSVAGHFGTEQCGSCHVAGAGTTTPFKFLHRSADGATVGTCLPCHEARRKSPTHYAGVDCASCHLDPAKTWLMSVKSPHPANNPMPVSCGGCHESARPSNTRIGASGPLLGGHFATQDCISCHEPANGGSVTAFRFSHTANGSSQASCVGCHEARRPSLDHYTGKDCAQCHTDPAKPWYAASVSPHPENSPMPSKCSTCHEGQRPATVLNPAPGARASGHFSGQDCNVCHEPRTNTVLQFRFVHQPLGKMRTSCLPCHEARRPAPTHFTGEDCVNCHSNPGQVWSAAVASPHPLNDPPATACNGCHEKNRPVSTLFPATTAAVPGHFGANDCYNCHVARSNTVSTFLFNHQANGIARTSCLPCHDSGRPAGVVQRFNHSPYGSGDCINCHKQTTAWAGGIYAHSPAPNVCSECHSADRPVTVVNRFSHSEAGTGECASCHTRPGVTWSGGTYSHSPRPAACATCHESNRPAVLVNRFEHKVFGQGECATCHASPGVTWADGKYAHSPRPLGCAICHESNRPTQVVNRFDHATYGTGDCVSCHENPGVSWAGGQYAHSPAPATCSSCHVSERPTQIVNRFDHTNFGTADCAGCHKQPGVTWTGGTYAHSPVPASCNSCHTSDRPATAVYPKGTTVTGHYTAKDCFVCHRPKSATLTTFTFGHSNYLNANINFCLPCHNQDGQSKHRGDSKVNFTGDGNCYSCHTRKRSWSR